MAKILTVQILINTDNQAEIDAFSKSLLDNATAAFPETIIDSAVIGETASPNHYVQSKIAFGTYSKGFAFTPAHSVASHMLVMIGDVDPEITGPFDTAGDCLTAARNYRAANGNDDGIYSVEAPRGIPVEVQSFSGGELELQD